MTESIQFVDRYNRSLPPAPVKSKPPRADLAGLTSLVSKVTPDTPVLTPDTPFRALPPQALIRTAIEAEEQYGVSFEPRDLEQIRTVGDLLNQLHWKQRHLGFPQPYTKPMRPPGDKASLPLREGLRQHDLADLVLPLISVDEYLSKIDPDEAIVFGFYVHDEAAAKDLNRFLQKSAVPLLGTDVSPAPDQHGYFMVFVEMMDNDRLAENLEAILHELSTLVDLEDWQLRIRELDDLVDYSAKNLRRGLAHAKKESKKAEVVEYLQHSALRNAEFSGALLILEGGGDRFCFDFVDFDRISTLMRDHRLNETGVKYDIRAVAKSNKIVRMLGEDWDASRLGAYIMIHQDADTRGLLLKL